MLNPEPRHFLSIQCQTIGCASVISVINSRQRRRFCDACWTRKYPHKPRRRYSCATAGCNGTFMLIKNRTINNTNRRYCDACRATIYGRGGVTWPSRMSAEEREQASPEKPLPVKTKRTRERLVSRDPTIQAALDAYYAAGKKVTRVTLARDDRRGMAQDAESVFMGRFEPAEVDI